MTHDTRIALFLMGELVAAQRANDPDLFKRWLYGGWKEAPSNISGQWISKSALM